jgi:subtilisin family serine protease
MPVAHTSVAAFVPGTLAVTYGRNASSDRIGSVIASLHGNAVSDLDLSAVHTRIVRVDPSQIDGAVAKFKAVPGVKSVGRVGYRARTTIVSNDPYYGGFGAPSPYFETSATYGQWDMHVINAEAAWNAIASTPPVAAASARIAVVDTGVDVTHPELTGGSIVRTQCFVTFPDTSAQTTGAYVTDTDGHGTNVAGIAAGDTDNGLGFAGASYDAKLMAYRVFPSDPAGGCDGNNPPAQCFLDTADEAAAINDAVSNGAKVINLSLGGAQPCTTNDPEYQAVENAIAHNVVVVAASGNGTGNPAVGQPELDCPANDPGVIAVGASAVDDSLPGVEAFKVASYSNYLTTNGTSSGGAFLVAPGGDPTGTGDGDDLHWIEHIYSSTAVQPGDCGPDYRSTSSAGDCKVQIAGTSMATPHVAAAAVLILTVRPNYTPAQVATALCNGAANIGDSKEGCGQLDEAAAVQYAQSH